MSAYQLSLRPRAHKEFLDLPTEVAHKIHDAIQLFQANPRPRQSIKLSGGQGYRLRVGDYRILYEIDDPGKMVTVYRIKHRREAYR